MIVTDKELKIDRNRLDEEVIRQPELFYAASKQYVDLVSRRDGLKKDMENYRAELANAFRHKAELKEKRTTEASISEQVDLDHEHRIMVKTHLVVKRDADLMEALRDAFHQRAFVLRDLVSLYSAGYFADTSIRGAASASMNDQATQRRREGINQQRQRLQKDR